MGRISWCEGIPGVNCEGFLGGKDFLVGRNSQWEGFPGGREFQV